MNSYEWGSYKTSIAPNSDLIYRDESFQLWYDFMYLFCPFSALIYSSFCNTWVVICLILSGPLSVFVISFCLAPPSLLVRVSGCMPHLRIDLSLRWLCAQLPHHCQQQQPNKPFQLRCHSSTVQKLLKTDRSSNNSWRKLLFAICQNIIYEKKKSPKQFSERSWLRLGTDSIPGDAAVRRCN